MQEKESHELEGNHIKGGMGQLYGLSRLRIIVNIEI